MTSIVKHCIIGVGSNAGRRTTSTRQNCFLGVFYGLKFVLIVNFRVYWEEKLMNKLKKHRTGDDDNGLETLRLETEACASHSLHTQLNSTQLDSTLRALLSKSSQ